MKTHSIKSDIVFLDNIMDTLFYQAFFHSMYTINQISAESVRITVLPYAYIFPNKYYYMVIW